MAISSLDFYSKVSFVLPSFYSCIYELHTYKWYCLLSWLQNGTLPLSTPPYLKSWRPRIFYFLMSKKCVIPYRKISLYSHSSRVIKTYCLLLLVHLCRYTHMTEFVTSSTANLYNTTPKLWLHFPIFLIHTNRANSLQAFLVSTII